MRNSTDELTKFEASFLGSTSDKFHEFKAAAFGGMDKSFKIMHSAYDMCGMVVSSLNTYSDAYTGQIDLINDWISILEVSNKDLSETMSTFDTAAGKLSDLKVELENYFKNNKQSIIQVMVTIDKSMNNIDEIKAQLEEEFPTQQEIQSKLKEIKTNIEAGTPELKNDILWQIGNVIIKCNQYRTTHNVFFF